MRHEKIKERDADTDTKLTTQTESRTEGFSMSNCLECDFVLHNLKLQITNRVTPC
jgi:hypothetical protein